jgi:four helix bundle protein
VPNLARSSLIQLVKSGTAIGANYRAAGRARSYREFTARLGVVAEEADESDYWFDILTEALDSVPQDVLEAREEAGQLRGIFASACATAEARLRRREREQKERRNAEQRSRRADL